MGGHDLRADPVSLHSAAVPRRARRRADRRSDHAWSPATSKPSRTSSTRRCGHADRRDDARRHDRRDVRSELALHADRLVGFAGALWSSTTTPAACQLKSVRDQISFVLQDTPLFRATIWENIAYGKPDASPAATRHAAELANASEFIDAMPDGYDTMVGERGITLSGGQRQRIAIARASGPEAILTSTSRCPSRPCAENRGNWERGETDH